MSARSLSYQGAAPDAPEGASVLRIPIAEAVPGTPDQVTFSETGGAGTITAAEITGYKYYNGDIPMIHLEYVGAPKNATFTGGFRTVAGVLPANYTGSTGQDTEGVVAGSGAIRAGGVLTPGVIVVNGTAISLQLAINTTAADTSMLAFQVDYESA